ncbi:MAG: HAMP domain-containing histidine kinase [Clostridiales bacterium]|nr:HAMP domain-containing histidine kinase [Clostridiales bacterium]
MLWEYIKAHIKAVGIFILFTLVFALVFALYDLPGGAVRYAALVCAFLGVVFFAFDFRAFAQKHRRLEQLYREVTVTLNSLPKPNCLPETDYQNALWELFRDRQKLERDKERRYAELVDYYTLWAHQIKTPIAAMRLLLQENDIPQNRELTEELQRIEQYVEMVLCYLRLDSDSTDFVIREYDLDDIVRQAVRKYAPQFIRKKIQLVYEPLNCHVLTDEKWLLFVVEQVLTNALKYTRTGAITITLEQPKTLCIRDTGIGIAPEDVPRVFEKGFTGYNGRSDKRATGIGLYLCRRILKKLSHGISIASELGHGTAVRIDLASDQLEVE